MGEAVDRLIELATNVREHVRHEAGRVVTVHAYSRLGQRIKAKEIGRGTVFHHAGTWYRAHSSAKPERRDRPNLLGYRVPHDTGHHIIHVAKINTRTNTASGYHELRLKSDETVHLTSHAATKRFEPEGWSSPHKRPSRAGVAFERRDAAMTEFKKQFPNLFGGKSH